MEAVRWSKVVAALFIIYCFIWLFGFARRMCVCVCSVWIHVYSVFLLVFMSNLVFNFNFSYSFRCVQIFYFRSENWQVNLIELQRKWYDWQTVFVCFSNIFFRPEVRMFYSMFNGPFLQPFDFPVSFLSDCVIANLIFNKKILAFVFVSNGNYFIAVAFHLQYVRCVSSLEWFVCILL